MTIDFLRRAPNHRISDDGERTRIENRSHNKNGHSIAMSAHLRFKKIATRSNFPLSVSSIPVHLWLLYWDAVPRGAMRNAISLGKTNPRIRPRMAHAFKSTTVSPGPPACCTSVVT